MKFNLQKLIFSTESDAPLQYRLSLLLVFILCITYLLFQVNAQAYNLVFSDQIDLFMGYLHKESLATLFLQQHGPHRQGMGAILMLPTLKLANWDMRSLSYLIVLFMALSTVFFLLAIRKRSVHIMTSIALIVLTLSLGSVELITVVPNISHSTLPVFFASLLFWVLLRDRIDGAWQHVAILVIIVLALFTGFGIFLFLSYALVFTVQVISERLQKDKQGQTSLIVILSSYAVFIVSLVLFFSNYNISRSEGCSTTAMSNIGDVIASSFAVASIPLGGSKLGALALPAGFIVISLFTFIGLLALIKLIRHRDRASFAILVLIFASGAFVINVAIGRHCLGIESVYASRYYPLVTLGIVGSLFALDIWFRAKYPVTVKAVSIFVIAVTLLSVNPTMKVMSENFYGHKNNFALCLESGVSVIDCNTKFGIYPPSGERLEQLLSMIIKSNE